MFAAAAATVALAVLSGPSGIDRASLPAKNGNMNGKYAVWSSTTEGAPFADWNDDYKSKGYEYFDVWAPEMATHYGQVFWTDQGNNKIPDDIIKRFANKTMAIVGYEQDQVMVTPRGQPGLNPDKDVSVPINWAYNHHYMAWMTGADSEMVQVETKGDEDFGMGWHGRKTHMEPRQLPSAKYNGAPGIPTSQMFSEGNGGESRKSFHGYPKGYAQLIHSPTAWHITPMQIDTRNRDCGVTPESVSNCTQFRPWYRSDGSVMEPKQARYGRGIGAEGTNYSGILECPCNSNHGGSPQYYGEKTLTKQITHHYSAVDSGVCSAGRQVDSAVACFGSVSQLGFNATKFVNSSVSIASQPAGCTVTVGADGVATVQWNRAESAAGCAESTTKVGATNAIGVKLGLQLSSQGGPESMVRGPKGQYCSDNQKNVLKKFPTKTTTDPAQLNAALLACEQFCEATAACTACSVDQVQQKFDQWVAITECGAVSTWAGAIPGDISRKTTSGTATITISGPASGYFAVGFNAMVMSDSPYTIVVNSTDVWEQKLGTCGSEAEHCPGDKLESSIKVVSKSMVDGVRTVVMTRPYTGATAKHYTFNAAAQSTIPLIVAIGGDQVFEQHMAHANSIVSLANPVGTPTCVCDLGKIGKLCDYNGQACGSFTKNCVPAPAGSLLEQRNPTCNSRQYVGGLTCCKHNRIMLDQEDQATSMAAPTLNYHMKWRFWFQEYVPAASAAAQPSHHDLPRIYFQTEANAGEYDIPPAYSVPGNPVAGYPDWPLNQTTPGTSCTGNCPDGPDCECLHTITFKFSLSNTRLIYAGGHCHAPACKDIRLYRNDTGHEMELLCHQMPIYGEGKDRSPVTKEDMYDEAGYLALPPCLWGVNETGLQNGIFLPPNTPMVSIKRNFNTRMGHYGEMASWQMRGVNFPAP